MNAFMAMSLSGFPTGLGGLNGKVPGGPKNQGRGRSHERCKSLQSRDAPSGRWLGTPSLIQGSEQLEGPVSPPVLLGCPAQDPSSPSLCGLNM